MIGNIDFDAACLEMVSIPETKRAICTTGYKIWTIGTWATLDSIDFLEASIQYMKVSACVDIPYMQSGVATCGDDERTSRMHNKLDKIAVMSTQSMLQVCIVGGPNLDEMIITSRDDETGGVIEKGGENRKMMTYQTL